MRASMVVDQGKAWYMERGKGDVIQELVGGNAFIRNR